MSYITNIIAKALGNEHFREVVYTGDKSQLVVMSIPPKGDIGEEVHERVEQTIFIARGLGMSVLDGQEKAIAAGDVLVVSPGVRHNVINTGAESLKIYTVYAPANHIDGRIHATKAEAEADTADEEFGASVK